MRAVSLIRYTVFHPFRVFAIVLIGALTGLGAFYTYKIQSTFEMVAIELFDPAEARGAIGTIPDFSDLVDEPGVVDPEPPTESGVRDPREVFPTAFGEPIEDAVFDSYLLLGTDASGFLADAIILALQPATGGSPIMVSLPRDLYVWNLCKNRFSRLNEGLGGCPDKASGAELMAIMVEDYTGIPVDHLARVNFGGFARIVDTMGGIRVCVDRPTRDLLSHLEPLEPGCHTVDGEVALAWVRSRHPEELFDDEWRSVGGSDFGRQTRQQDVLFQLAAKAARFSSPNALVDRLSAVASSVRLDSEWTFGQAISVGWRYRGITKDEVRRFTIEVDDYRSPEGAAVLVPERTFTDQLAEVYELE
ncbi:MAG: LCP family protein [Actinobacteria bacterium]|nr:LCP family protein [Actinomycetota bacterium]